MSIEVTPQSQSDPAQRGIQWQVYLALIICLVVTGLLSSLRLVAIAERMPFGPARDALLVFTQSVNSVAQATGFDRPAAWLDQALGPRDALPTFETGGVVQAAPAPLAPTPPSRLAQADPPTATPPAPPTAAPSATAATTRTPEPMPTATPAATTETRPTPQATPTVLDVPPTPVPTAPPPSPTATRGPTGPQRVVTADNPLRVLVAGDSFAQPLGLELQRYGNRFKTINAQIDFRLSSGLARPDFFDWPKRMSANMNAQPPPEVVVFFAGANDTQNMWTDNGLAMGRSPEWQQEYARRAAAIMDIVGERGGRLYWVGMPVMREEFRAQYAHIQNQAVQSEAEVRPWVHFVDTWTLFQGPDGGFATYIADDKGEQVQVRQNDGVHLTWAGNGWVVALAYRAMERDFGFTSPE